MADKQLTGLCGEHYVAALLAGHGLVVALPRGGAARADLFVADSKRGRAIRVQVKSGKQAYSKYQGKMCYSWDVNCSIIDSHDEGLWYAFVSLGEWPADDSPKVFFVPSAYVAARMESQKDRKRTFFWMFEPDLATYRDSTGVDKLKAALAEPCQVP